MNLDECELALPDSVRQRKREREREKKVGSRSRLAAFTEISRSKQRWTLDNARAAD